MKLNYKNIGITTKTFYGVEFKPGETHEVPGFINSPRFIRVDSSEISKKLVVQKSAPTQVKSAPVKEDLKPATDSKKTDTSADSKESGK